jgi:hypothetical protein
VNRILTRFASIRFVRSPTLGTARGYYAAASSGALLSRLRLDIMVAIDVSGGGWRWK